MDIPQENDLEDWSRLERAVVTLGVITVLDDVPRTEGGEKPHAETSRENVFLKEKQSEEETQNMRPSKRRKHGHKDGPRKLLIPRGKRLEILLRLLFQKWKKVTKRCLTISNNNLWR